MCHSVEFILADRSKCLQYNAKHICDLGLFVFSPAGLLLPRSSVSSSQLVLADQCSQSFPPPAELQHPGLGRQRQRLRDLAAPQRTAPRDVAGGPVVRDGVPEGGAYLRTRLVSFHQHEGGLQRVR